MKSPRPRSSKTTARSRGVGATMKMTDPAHAATGTATPMTGHDPDAGAMKSTKTAPVPGGIVTRTTPTNGPVRAAGLKTQKTRICPGRGATGTKRKTVRPPGAGKKMTIRTNARLDVAGRRTMSPKRSDRGRAGSGTRTTMKSGRGVARDEPR
jgi:hypothetical protein